jgi:UDP-glucose 4-epimerase
VIAGRVLVTGANGFLGRHLVSRLRSASAEVHTVGRQPSSEVTPVECRWTANVADEREAREVVQRVRPNVVVHLGALTHAAPDLELVLPTFHSALASTVNLLTALTEQGCRRIVLAGSIEEPVGGAEARPASPYAAAKWAASAYGRMFHALYDTPVVIARLALTYGPGQLARKVIPSTIFAVLRGEAPQVSSGARAWDVVYVDDVIEALVRLVEGRGPDGATVDVGSGRLTTLRSIVERVVAIVDPTITPVFGVVPDRPLTETHAADAAATEAMLDWRATTSLEAGLRTTVDWCRTHMNRLGRHGVAP